MDLKERKNYFIFTSIFWCIGFIAYGTIAAIGKEWVGIPWNTFLVFLVYGLGGGWLLGGLFSGILLFIHFIKYQKLAVKIISAILFQITIMIICVGGIVSFIPYWIYNLVVMRKMKRAEEVY